MSDTIDQPGEWTTSGIAYCQVAIARNDLVDVCAMIRRGDTYAATEQITETIRQLEAARRMIA